ncbi:MAG: serine/threonine protein kinase [Gemmatimonadetes bacterium]|nr:serine/threonine protein kinase [Gemmatimonadota bacterium]NNM05991.1 serine/threonine protein kinase [Gemmatimonadota bacterium]
MDDLLTVLRQELRDRYQVDREIGKGGMAAVFQAQDLKHHRAVAIKVLLPELASVLGSERFLREIQIAANLRHPHILPLLDSGEVGGLPFYVMPYVEGESVRDRLDKEKQLPIEETLQIGMEVTDALAYAHEKGVVHRDIKPANIMMDSGHAVVADFGIALATQQVETNRLTASGVSPGSPHYMSPEQAAGDEDIDGRSDIYSLGCVLFEALTGDPPFTGRLPQAILARKLREAPPSPRVVRDSIPESLERLILTALARSPADRFRGAAEMGEALRASSEGLSVSAIPGLAAFPSDPPSPFSLRSLGGTVRLLLAAGVVFTVVGFLTNLAYDVKLGIPSDYTPSRWDFPVLGLRALIPVLVFGLGASVAFWILGNLWRILSAGLQRTPGVGKTYDSLRNTATGVWRNMWTPLSPKTVADVFLLGAIVAGLVSLAPFREYLGAVWSTEREILSLANRPLHERYNEILAPIVVVLLMVWRGVFRYLRKRGPLEGRVRAVRWSSLAWIGFLVIMATLPWRLAYNSYHERARINGERVYILRETDAEVLVYRAESGTTVRHSKSGNLQIQRLGTVGYLFEEPEYFDAAEEDGYG